MKEEESLIDKSGMGNSIKSDTPLVSIPATYVSEEARYVSVCWKCKGTGLKPVKKKNIKTIPLKCTVCNGMSKLLPNHTKKHKPLRPFRTNSNWVVPGPKSKYEMNDPKMAPAEDEMLSSLSGHWCIYQLENGHRMTTDDVCVAAIAIQHLRNTITELNHLDIGTGLSSVLSMIHWAFYDKIQKSIGIEAQAIHVSLAQKTLEFNGVRDRCQIIHQDLRDISDANMFPFKFDLITGTPPYFPPPNGTLPTVPGRGMCAFEFRGGIELYCRIASLFLKRNEQSRFIVANTSIEIQRTEAAGTAVGFKLIERWDVHGKIDKTSLFSVFIFKWDSTEQTNPHPLERQSIESCPVRHINVRGLDGQFTDEYSELMSLVGKPPPTYETGTIPQKRNRDS
ncbi:hypothetical protein BC833DRAFT_662632 [Globomyces pollinis-pini]|nr:hypothetical protein BC833DRAFT_662632 [Globomyces pollinis-pini]